MSLTDRRDRSWPPGWVRWSPGGRVEVDRKEEGEIWPPGEVEGGCASVLALKYVLREWTFKTWKTFILCIWKNSTRVAKQRWCVKKSGKITAVTRRYTAWLGDACPASPKIWRVPSTDILIYIYKLTTVCGCALPEKPAPNYYRTKTKTLIGMKIFNKLTFYIVYIH